MSKTEDNAKIERIVRRFQRVAEANDDQFSCTIAVNSKATPISYEMIVEERAERHLFCSGYGQSPVEAAEDALTNLQSSCDSWGYKNVD